MRRCRVTIENVPGSPYSQSALHDTPKLDREDYNDYDRRTWREHCTVNTEGIVCIPAMAFKQCIDTAAYKLGMKIPGRRGATYKSFFASGFLCDHDVPIANGKPLTKDAAELVAIWADSQGKRGGSSRVQRRFPSFAKYSGEPEFTILDDLITADIFETHLRAAGILVGLGRFRAENGGTNGRFRVIKSHWEDIDF